MSAPEKLPYRHMVRPVSGADRIPKPPAGITIVPFDPSRDAAAVYALLAPTYDEVDDGLVLEPFARWLPALLNDEEFCRDAVFLAQSVQGDLAGMAICWRNGFIYDLAVAAIWRKHGIAECLLRHAFAYFGASDVENVALKVTRDNPTGAERLYTRLGFVDLAQNS